MTGAEISRWEIALSFPNRMLNWTATRWFAVAAIGHYGPLVIQVGPQGLAESPMPGGYVAGDSDGNAAALSPGTANGPCAFLWWQVLYSFFAWV